MDPFNPTNLFFFRTMFKIPAIPSGSYFAVGFVMTSTRSMELAGIAARNDVRAAPVMPEGRPSIRICTLPDPRNVMLPSMSTATLGTFASSSVAVAPLAVRSLPTLNTRRSIIISSVLRSSTTSAASSASTAGSSRMSPRFTAPAFSLGLTINGLRVYRVYPMKLMVSTCGPNFTSPSRNVPSSPASVPPVTALSRGDISAMLAYGMG